MLQGKYQYQYQYLRLHQIVPISALLHSWQYHINHNGIYSSSHKLLWILYHSRSTSVLVLSSPLPAHRFCKLLMPILLLLHLLLGVLQTFPREMNISYKGSSNFIFLCYYHCFSQTAKRRLLYVLDGYCCCLSGYSKYHGYISVYRATW